MCYVCVNIRKVGKLEYPEKNPRGTNTTHQTWTQLLQRRTSSAIRASQKAEHCRFLVNTPFFEQFEKILDNRI